MSTQRVVHVLLYPTWADWEIGLLTAHLLRPDWQSSPGTFAVRYVTVDGAPVTSAGGMVVQPDLALTDLDPAHNALLVLPGNDIWPTPEFDVILDTARSQLASGVPVAAICGATGGLARAGLLDDVRHTSNAAEFLASIDGYAGAAHYTGEQATVDGDLVTGSGVHPAAFAAAIFERLGVYSPEVLSSWRKLYVDGNPEGFYELMAQA